MSTPLVSSKKEMAAHLRSIRLARGYSQAKLGAETGINNNSIARLENGKNVTRSTMERYARWAGVPEAQIQDAGRLYKSHPGEYSGRRANGAPKKRPYVKSGKYSGRNARRAEAKAEAPTAPANGLHVHQETALALLRDAKTLLDAGRSNKLIASRISAALVILELQDAE